MKTVVIVGVATLALVAALGATARDSDHMLVAYETSLSGRTGAQRHNSVLAALRIDGTVIEPGEVFSFNQTVGTFSRDAGYRRAPVSYNGDLIKDWGGGVCQTSTTLYNAALIAGFPIVERFHHRTAPSYVPAGRDAAVAYPGIDLRFRNDLAEPVRLHTFVEGNHLRVEIWTKSAIQRRAEIVTHVLARRRPSVLRLALGPHSQGVRATGREGFEVSVYRRLGDKESFVSHDSYPSMDTLIGVPQ